MGLISRVSSRTYSSKMAKSKKDRQRTEAKRRKRTLELISKDENAMESEIPDMPIDKLGWKTIQFNDEVLKTADLQGLISFEEIDGDKYFDYKKSCENEEGGGDDFGQSIDEDREKTKDEENTQKIEQNKSEPNSD